MLEFGGLARMLVIFGVVLVGIGLLVGVVGKVPGLGRLPGDILIRREGFTFFFPITTSIIISVVLTLLFFLWRR